MEERYINPYTDFGFKKAEIARYSPQDRMAYEESLKVYRDLRNVVSTAERKGMAQGLERGRAEGRAEGEYTKAVAIARQLKAMGMQHCDIASATGLSLDEITSLG